MLKGVKTALYLSTCGMVLSGYLALASTQEYDFRILVIPVGIFALVPLAEWLDGRFRVYRFTTTAITYAYTVVIPVSWLSYGLFPAVVALVIYIQAYKLLHRKEEHDYHHIYLMSFFLLVAACVLSPDASIAIPFLTFLVSAVASFFALQVQGEARRCTGSCEGDVVALHLRRPAYSGRREHFVDASLLASYTAITLACVMMTTAFFVVTPRMQAGVLGGTSMQPIRQFTGLADSVDLSQGGPSEINTAPVMRVFLPDEPGGRFDGPLYWRNTSFDRFNDTGWDNTSEPAEFYDGRTPMRFLARNGLLDRTSAYKRARLVRQVVYLDDIPSKGLPALPLVRQVRWKDARLNWDVVKADSTVEIVAVRRNSLLYEAVSEIDIPVPDELRNAPAEYEGSFQGLPIMKKDVYGRLTYHTLSEPAVDLARRITQPYNNPYDKAVAVERFLSKGDYLYSLGSAKNLTNPVDNFILVAKTGHCELFASAMALMLRSVGIPARVVSGFRGGDWNSADRSYTLRSNMAHLWVEVYFIGYGWARFDPSAPDTTTPSGIGGTLRQYLTNQLLKGKMMWYQDVVGYSAKSPISGMLGLSLGILKELPMPWRLFDAEGQTPKAVQPILTRDSVAWLLLAGLMLFGLSALRRRRLDRQKNNRAGALNRDQLRAIHLFKSVLRRVRRTLPELDGKTAEEIARMLVQTDAGKAKTAQKLLEAYTETRFGGRPMSRARYLELQKAGRALTDH